MNNNGGGRVASYLALAASLSAVLVPMGMGIVDLRTDLARVEESAAAARDAIRSDLREYMSSVERRLQDAINAHNTWAFDRNADVEKDTSDFRERIRALEAKLVALNTENEGQHKWIKDAVNTLAAQVERRTRVYWDGNRLVWPDVEDLLLDDIGEARMNGNGGK